MRLLRLSLALGGMLLAANATAQTVDIDRPVMDDPQIRELPDELWRWGREGDGLEDPRLQKLEACLADSSDQVDVALEKVKPVISRPHAGVLCRLRRQVELLGRFQPEAAPPSLHVPAAVPGDMTEVRQSNAGLVAKARVHWRHHVTLRDQSARLGALLPDRDRLAAKLERLAAADLPDLAAFSLNFRIARSEVCQGSAEKAASRAAKVAQENSDLAFLPELRNLLAGVNLSAGVVVPAGVSLCEAGAGQRTCVAQEPVDWESPCWKEVVPAQADALPCHEKQPEVRSSIEIGTGCAGDYEHHHAPFFTAPHRDAERELTAPWQELQETLAAWPAAAAGAASRLDTRRAEDRTDVLPALLVLKSRIQQERGPLDAERIRLDAELAVLRELAATLASLAAAIQALTQQETQAATAIQTATATLATLQTRTDVAAAEVERTRQEVEARVGERDGIVLQCGGRDYSTCLDAAAKQQYDQARYEALRRLSTARQAWQAATARLLQLRRDRLRIRGELQTARTQRTGAVQQRTVSRQKLVRADEEHKRRLPIYQADEARYRILRPAFDSDEATLRAMMADYEIVW